MRVFLLIVVHLINLTLATSDEPTADVTDGWEYEPRVWAPDEPRDLAASETFEGSEEDFEEPRDTNLANQANREDVRAKSNFWRDQKSKTTTKLSQRQELRCDQWRVDVKETVICDKKRCDKLDFEWPIHDNQLTVIETTRHGMRFHRADFAFGPPTGNSQNPKVKQFTATGQKRNNNNNNESSGKIKFDIFELFKPKPQPPTTPTPRTTKLTSDTNDDETTRTTTTPTPTTTQTPRPDNEDSQQDNNSTQLVTTFRLDTRRRMQTMLGFGGALSDSTCRNIKSLSSAMSSSLMEDYFGPRGLRYNIVRMSMGSSDFSTTPYTNNDKSDEQQASNKLRQSSQQLRPIKRMALDETDDVEMKKFRLVDEDYEFKLPVARQAIATSRQEIKFYSSLWSPPIWMKNNSHIVHGYLKGDIYGPYYKALADLIVKWLEAYRRNGIEFWATTGLNEPITGVKPFIFHNSLGITKQDYVTFIKIYLGPMLRQRGFGNVKLIAMDDNKGYAHSWARAVLDDQEAAKYVSGIGVHWYMNDEYENLNFLAKDYPDKFILSTEACNGYLPFQVHTLPGDWDRGVAYMYDIVKLIQKNAVGWVDWNMALDLGGGPSWAKNNLDAPIIVNAERDEYYKSPMFYAIGHFSRFVPPNSTRLDHRLANARYDHPFEAVAFYTPQDYIVIVVLNANKHPVLFRVIVNRQLVKIVNLREDSFSTIIFKSKRSRN